MPPGSRVDQLAGPEAWRPDEMLAAAERRQILERLVTNARYRTLLRWRYAEGRTNRSIAAEWGVTEPAVWRMEQRALLRLRQALLEMGIESMAQI